MGLFEECFAGLEDPRWRSGREYPEFRARRGGFHFQAFIAFANRSPKMTAICALAAVHSRGGDYVLVLKANQPTLLDDVRLYLEDPRAPPDDRGQTVEGDHGRIETRVCEVLHDVAFLDELHGWPGLKAIGRITATRESAGKTARQTRYFLLSRPLSAARLAEVARVHWTIENQLHWPLDVHLDEDGSRSRKDHGPENLALLRRFAPNLLRANRDKLSVRRKIKQAGWNDAFLLKLLAQA